MFLFIGFIYTFAKTLSKILCFVNVSNMFITALQNIVLTPPAPSCVYPTCMMLTSYDVATPTTLHIRYDWLAATDIAVNDDPIWWHRWATHNKVRVADETVTLFRGDTARWVNGVIWVRDRLVTEPRVRSLEPLLRRQRKHPLEPGQGQVTERGQ